MSYVHPACPVREFFSNGVKSKSPEATACHCISGGTSNRVNLKERYYHTVARNLFLNQEFFKILDSFSQKDVLLIPLKGIALIQKLYPDLGSRYIGDIDLLVKVEDILKATNLLKKLGYSGSSSYFIPSNPYSIYFNSLSFTKPAKIPYFVHLHWHLLNSSLPLFMYRIDMKKIWQKAVLEKCHNREILMMDPHHLIVYLSIHAFKHSFDQISVFHDIQNAIEFYRDKLDWKVVIEIAKDWKATVPLYYSLYLTSELLEVDFLKDILNIIESEKITQGGYRIISSISKDKLGTNNLIFPLYLDMLKGLLNKIKFIFLSLFPPPCELCRIYSVNCKYLIFFYYFKRLSCGFGQFLKLVIQLSLPREIRRISGT